MIKVGEINLKSDQKLLDELIKEGVRFEIEVDDSGITHMDPISAGHGGTFGSGVVAYLHIHRDDYSWYEIVCRRLSIS